MIIVSITAIAATVAGAVRTAQLVSSDGFGRIPTRTH